MVDATVGSGRFCVLLLAPGSELTGSVGFVHQLARDPAEVRAQCYQGPPSLCSLRAYGPFWSSQYPLRLRGSVAVSEHSLLPCLVQVWSPLPPQGLP